MKLQLKDVVDCLPVAFPDLDLQFLLTKVLAIQRNGMMDC
jgi:hypothetical protein